MVGTLEGAMVATGTSKKRGGRPGYRKPDAKRDRLSFRLPETLSVQLERHRFEQEDTQSLITRMVKLSAKHPTDHIPFDFAGGKVRHYSFRTEPTVLAYLESLPVVSPQKKMEYVLSRSVFLPPTAPISSPLEALEVIKSSGLQGKVDVECIVNLLAGRCAEIVARSFIKKLHDDGLVTLIQSSDRTGSVKRINIGGKQYALASL
jgi:hypothetical protein